MSDELLGPADLKKLCGTADRTKQPDALRDLGIPFRLAGGRVLVSRVHVRDWINGVQLRQPVAPRLDRVK